MRVQCLTVKIAPGVEMHESLWHGRLTDNDCVCVEYKCDQVSMNGVLANVSALSRGEKLQLMRGEVAFDEGMRSWIWYNVKDKASLTAVWVVGEMTFDAHRQAKKLAELVESTLFLESTALVIELLCSL